MVGLTYGTQTTYGTCKCNRNNISGSGFQWSGKGISVKLNVDCNMDIKLNSYVVSNSSNSLGSRTVTLRVVKNGVNIKTLGSQSASGSNQSASNTFICNTTVSKGDIIAIQAYGGAANSTTSSNGMMLSNVNGSITIK